jgi:drug/metabolite transporter (DMT)-like permease
MLLIMGFQRETASRGALAVYTSVCLLHRGSFKVSQLFQAVFAIMFDYIVFNTTPSALSITGAAIVISSAIYTSVLSSHSFHLDICSYAPVDKKYRHQIRRWTYPRAASVHQS